MKTDSTLSMPDASMVISLEVSSGPSSITTSDSGLPVLFPMSQGLSVRDDEGSTGMGSEQEPLSVKTNHGKEVRHAYDHLR